MICSSCNGAGCKVCMARSNPKIFIPIEPMGAVRTTQKAKHVSTTYQRYAAYKEHIALLVAGRLNILPRGVAIAVDVTFYMPIPKSGKIKLNNKQIKVVEGQAHIFKPDIDNLIKGLFDSLNGIAWADDNQVFEVKSRKVYSEYPGIEFRIEILGG